MMSESVNDFVAEGGRVLVSDDHTDSGVRGGQAGIAHAAEALETRACSDGERHAPDDDRTRLMSAFSIVYDGRRYRFSGYRYDRIEDAVAYAELLQSRQSIERGPHPFPRDAPIPGPSPVDRETMAALSISFCAGLYVYRGFRYDELADAVSYARLERRGTVMALHDVRSR